MSLFRAGSYILGFFLSQKQSKHLGFGGLGVVVAGFLGLVFVLIVFFGILLAIWSIDEKLGLKLL